jgi:2-dehydropantoate 2-reductase
LWAAGIDVASQDEDVARRGDLLDLHAVGGHERAGGSSWQSLQRGVGSVESDYLNGEIVLLGRRHGVPTPVNALLQELAWDRALSRGSPGGLSTEAFFQILAGR